MSVQKSFQDKSDFFENRFFSINATNLHCERRFGFSLQKKYDQDLDLFCLKTDPKVL